MINVGCLIIFSLTLAWGQILFKRLGLSVRGLPVGDALRTVISQPLLYGAVLLYGMATLLWVWILGRMPLSQAYPWVASGVLVVPVLGWWIYHEHVAPMFWLGALMIAAGLLIIQLAQRVGA